MWVFNMRRPAKIYLWLLIFAGVAIFAVSIWNYRRDQSVKVDRTTAMEVSKSVSGDSNLPLSINQDFFLECRLDRDCLRSEHSDILREVVKTAETDELRQKARNEIVTLVVDKEHEAETESLIKARGYTDALVLIQDNTASVIVKTASLSRDEVLAIADIVSRISSVKPENITISAKP
ncbi:MAG: SpoIIIAH-like protein [Firmicutes bacterium]|nr:SpoIIIAH-like protein [Bacillota bacterium]